MLLPKNALLFCGHAIATIEKRTNPSALSDFMRNPCGLATSVDFNAMPGSGREDDLY